MAPGFSVHAYISDAMQRSIAQRWRAAWGRALDNFRLRVSRPDALPQLALLGVISGVLAGLTIIAFRLTVQWIRMAWVPGASFGVEHYEHMPALWRLLLPLGGGVLLGLGFHFLADSERRVGVLHIMERLAYHQGHLPWRNALAQFLGGVAAIVSGQSIGREGPSAHLGAASSNLPAQALQLPNNSLRVMLACGAAAGIAASFNIPLAGTVFAMEVLMMEYTVAGFAPVILASVSATFLTRLVFGENLAFQVPLLQLGSLLQLPYIVVLGIAVGALGAGFGRVMAVLARAAMRMPVWLGLSLAGLVVGVCGLLQPAVLGIGDQAITRALDGHLEIVFLLTLLALKFIASSAALGLGIPGGVIGPSLVLGATVGALLGVLAAAADLAPASAVGMYALIGMGAMMAGTLQAPLTGLVAMLELTGHPQVLLPGMLAVITATITYGMLFRRESIFRTGMRIRGIDYRNDALAQSLRRVGVAGVMERGVATVPRQVERARAEQSLADNQTWLLVRDPDQPDVLLAAVDLVRALKENPDAASFDLRELPGARLQAAPIDMQASLQEARELMQESGAEALYVTRHTVPGVIRVYGVLLNEDIERGYRL